MPMVWLRRTARLRAAALRRYPSSSAARSIFARLLSLTLGDPESAKDTKDFDIPAREATSWMVGRETDMG
jgi:hypothetical protein